jgi:hypothetical protein
MIRFSNDDVEQEKTTTTTKHSVVLKYITEM